MDATVRPGNKPISPGFLDLYTPKLATVLRGGYGWRSLQADAIAGLTVAVVALPLSMAIAIASGPRPTGVSTPPSSAAFWSRCSAAAASKSAGAGRCLWGAPRALAMAEMGPEPD